MPDMISPRDIAEIRLALRLNADARAPELATAAGDADQDSNATAIEITGDVTGDFPIGPAELDAIETYLADVLDMVLAGDKDAPSALHCHKRMR